MEQLGGHQFCYLTTVGRRTARPHEIEIWYAAAPGASTLYLLSGGGPRADWVRNLMANPGVDVRLGDVTYRAIARILDQPGEEEREARRLVFEKYDPGYDGDLSRWRERALPVALDVDLPTFPGGAPTPPSSARRGPYPTGGRLSEVRTPG